VTIWEFQNAALKVANLLKEDIFAEEEPEELQEVDNALITEDAQTKVCANLPLLSLLVQDVQMLVAKVTAWREYASNFLN